MELYDLAASNRDVKMKHLFRGIALGFKIMPSNISRWVRVSVRRIVESFESFSSFAHRGRGRKSRPFSQRWQ